MQSLTLASPGVVLAQAVVGLLAEVAADAPYVLFAAALSCNHAQLRLCVAVTHATIHRAHRVTVTCWRGEKEGRVWAKITEY